MSAIFGFIALVLQIFSWIMIVRAIVSWIPSIDPHHPIVQLLYRVTEPVLEPVRKIIPPLGGTVDISFIIVYFALVILQQVFRGMAG